MFKQESWGNVNIYSNELMVQKWGLPQFSLQTIAFFVGLILGTAGHFKQFPLASRGEESSQYFTGLSHMFGVSTQEPARSSSQNCWLYLVIRSESLDIRP